MVNNNNLIIPKGNIAKVEEVREIEEKELITPKEQTKLVEKLVKNEVLSYEEFTKTYQEGEEMIDNYYYEIDSYGDISIVRSYGPGNAPSSFDCGTVDIINNPIRKVTNEVAGKLTEEVIKKAAEEKKKEQEKKEKERKNKESYGK